MELIEAEHPRPRHFLLHLSDPHLLGGTDPLHGMVDSDSRLRQLFDQVRASGARPEAVIFTGDLADRGEAEAYAKLRTIVDPACKAMGAKVIWAMGNHDDRANFRSGLLDQPGSDAPVDHSYFIDGLRIITLDTSVPGFHHGELTPSSLNGSPRNSPRQRRTAPSWPFTTRRFPPCWTLRCWLNSEASQRSPGCFATPMCAPSWAAICTIRRRLRLPASLSRSLRRPATRRT